MALALLSVCGMAAAAPAVSGGKPSILFLFADGAIAAAPPSFHPAIDSSRLFQWHLPICCSCCFADLNAWMHGRVGRWDACAARC